MQERVGLDLRQSGNGILINLKLFIVAGVPQRGGRVLDDVRWQEEAGVVGAVQQNKAPNTVRVFHPPKLILIEAPEPSLGVAHLDVSQNTTRRPNELHDT